MRAYHNMETTETEKRNVLAWRLSAYFRKCITSQQCWSSEDTPQWHAGCPQVQEAILIGLCLSRFGDRDQAL